MKRKKKNVRAITKHWLRLIHTNKFNKNQNYTSDDIKNLILQYYPKYYFNMKIPTSRITSMLNKKHYYGWCISVYFDYIGKKGNQKIWKLK